MVSKLRNGEWVCFASTGIIGRCVGGGWSWDWSVNVQSYKVEPELADVVRTANSHLANVRTVRGGESWRIVWALERCSVLSYNCAALDDESAADSWTKRRHLHTHVSVDHTRSGVCNLHMWVDLLLPKPCAQFPSAKPPAAAHCVLK